jgi:putative tricarboxylic transport membrane protein
MMEDLLAGAGLVLDLSSMLWLVFGVVIGFVAGAIPGVGAANAAALVLPFAIGLPPVDSLILIGGLYSGCLFAGAIPAILVNAPGEAGSAATALDGYPMALAGQAERAIGVARMSSVLGGVFAGTAVLLIIGPLGDIALRFGAREIFIVALFGISVIAIVMGDNIRKGMIAAIGGLLIASMAANPYTGQPRFTLGYIELYSEIPFVPAVIGLFGIAQMLYIASRSDETPASAAPAAAGGSLLVRATRSFREVLAGIRATLRYPITTLRSAFIGLIIGIIPGIGTASANFVSYGLAKRFSDEPESFGKGNPEGIVASEACDNAVANGTLIPTLTLGIPGSATAAIILAALYLHGIQPGPRLFANEAALVYAVVIASIIGSILILPLGVLLSAPLALVTRVKMPYLVSSVVLLCLIGTYAVRNSMFDVGLALLFGVLGLLMRLRNVPIVPLVLGLVLGPIAEENFLRARQLGRGQVSYFYGSPLTRVLWTSLALLILFSIWKEWRMRVARRSAGLPAERSVDLEGPAQPSRPSGDC